MDTNPLINGSGGFEEFWNEKFDRLNAYVKEIKHEGDQ